MTVRLTRPWSDLPAAVGQRYVSIIKRGAAAPLTAAELQRHRRVQAHGLDARRQLPIRAQTATISSPESRTSTAVDIVGIPDSVARVNALISGQVDVITDVPGVQVPQLESAGMKAIVNPGGGWTPLVMNTQRRAVQRCPCPPGDEAPDRPQAGDRGRPAGLRRRSETTCSQVRSAVRLVDPAADVRSREGRVACSGRRASSTAVHAPHSGRRVGLRPAGTRLRTGSEEGGRQGHDPADPADTFWDNTWGVAPFTFSSWGYRAFFTQWLQSFVSFNKQETRWNSSRRSASRLVYRAAATGDAARQKNTRCEAQRLHWDDGGYIIPYFKRQSTQRARRVNGIKPHVFPALSWYRIWNFWFS